MSHPASIILQSIEFPDTKKSVVIVEEYPQSDSPYIRICRWAKPEKENGGYLNIGGNLFTRAEVARLRDFLNAVDLTLTK